MGGRYGFELAQQWVNDPRVHVAAAGWSTLSNIVALKPDNELDIAALRALLARVEQSIHSSPNRVCATMNGFIISVGTYVNPLTNDAIAAAGRIGLVMVDKNGTACKTPSAAEYINKAKSKGVVQKKKTVKC